MLEKEALESDSLEVREENVMLFTENKLQTITNIGREVQVLNDVVNRTLCMMGMQD